MSPIKKETESEKNDQIIRSITVCVLTAQSCLTLCDPMDCSPPGSRVHGILQARILKCVAMPFQGIFPTQGSNSGLLHCRWILYHLSHQGSQKQGRLHLFMPHNTPLGQGPGSSGDIHNNIFLSSAGTKAPIHLEDRTMTLTLLNSITFSVDSVTLGPNSRLNAPLLKPPHE